MSTPMARPLIEQLTVGGLRAYGPTPVHVELAPLTLVFGPNSAGKSTLVSALTLLAQSTQPHPSRLLVMNGPLVDAGSFRMAVNRHDEGTPITLGLAFGPPPWRGESGDAGTGGAGSALGEAGGVGTGRREVEVQYQWDPQARLPTARRLSTAVGEDRDTTVLPATDGASAAALRRRTLLEELVEVLERVAYLGPLRARPQRTHLVGLGRGDYVGPEGEGLAEVLHTRADVLAETNTWLGRLGVGYEIRMLEPQSTDVVLTAGDFAVVGLLDVRQDPPVLVSSQAVGFGVGQLAPVVVQCLLSEQGTVVVEQPEVHIHPRLQAAVGDLFIDTVQSRGNQVLVETHSEHLVLRLLRRVREGVIAPTDLAILYVETHEDGDAFVRRLDVDPDGDIAGGWPGGFFAERLDEVLGGRFTSTTGLR